MQIKLLITDFDGTLVDTFKANYVSYREALERYGYNLTEKEYKECFGLRFDSFMKSVGIMEDDLKKRIREAKRLVYPKHFELLRINNTLLNFLRQFKERGGKIAIASTAARGNLMNALRYIGADKDFDIILAGEDVDVGKPDPEIYLKVIDKAGIDSEQALIFEDSEVGFRAAEAAGIRYIPVNLS